MIITAMDIIERKNMMKFNEFVYEDADHKDGTYISVKLSADSAKKLDEWAESKNISNLTEPSEYHCTVMYSKKGIPDAKKYDIGLPINTEISGWKIFPTQGGTKALVGVLASKELKDHHKNIMDTYKGSYDFPEYIPHVTVSYNHKGEAPKDVPTFELNFDRLEFKALDPEFVPPKKAK